MDRSEREEYDDYDGADRGRDDYREDSRYWRVVVMLPKNVVAPRSTPIVMIRMVMTIAPRITVVGRVVIRSQNESIKGVGWPLWGLVSYDPSWL